MVNPFTRTEGRLLFLRCLAADALDDLTSSDKLNLGDKGLHVDRMLIQHVARDDSGLSLMRRKDATSFLKRFMSVISDAVIQVCYQKAAKRRAFENNPFLSTEAGAAYINFAYIKFLKFWTKKIIEIDMTEKEKPSLGLLLENGPETICVPRSERRVESR